MKNLLLTVLCFTVCLSTHAQLPALQWVRNIGGSEGEKVVVDAVGNVYTAGHFSGTADFDPGAAVYSLNRGGNNDCFMVRLDADGNFLQALQVSGNYSEGDDISIDGAGNIYLCDNYNASADIDPGAGLIFRRLYKTVQ